MSAFQQTGDIYKSQRERLRIGLDEYQGVELIDIRATVELTESSGIRTPTKKGVSFRRDMLPDVLKALHEAHRLHFGKPYVEVS